MVSEEFGMGQYLVAALYCSMCFFVASFAVLVASFLVPSGYRWLIPMRRVGGVVTGACYGCTSVVFLLTWSFFTNASWWFVALVSVAWPVWEASTLSGQLWVLDLLPGWIWLPR
jgi:hypothetical protein